MGNVSVRGGRAAVPLQGLLLSALSFFWSGTVCGQSRFATSDSWKGYVHWIELYDENNSTIDPINNPKPYSPEKTCGRCHDYKTISHGWHFNASLSETGTATGRPGIPMIWNDARTGTFLPISYRGWQGTYHPKDLGLTPWQIAAKFGGYLPGMTVESPAAAAPAEGVDRTSLTGNLSIDCLLCHHRPGSGYSPFVWTEQIKEQNFKYAPTAASGLATVSGSLRRMKNDQGEEGSEENEHAPQVQYQADRFRNDGKVFVDLIRKPSSEACYYCHTTVATESPQGSRWMHDDDVHLRAGMQCADCHRHGLDHQMIRGFDGEPHGAGAVAATFSCLGCHLGANDSSNGFGQGRLGAPRPLHRGLPPLHFEKMSCTACHSGPVVEAEIGRQITSMAHELGTHIKRTGLELPAVFAGAILRSDPSGTIVTGPEEGKYTPHRLLWPSYWGIVTEQAVKPLNPEQAYELVRKPLKIRKDFVDDLAEVKLTLSQRKQILGDDQAARMKSEELSESQRLQLQQAEEAERKKQVEERMLAALAEIEKAFPGSQGAFVHGGTGVIRGQDGKLAYLESDKLNASAKPYAWPLAHTVRPAQQSLGIRGCNECHGPNAHFFYAQIQPLAVVPGQETSAIPLHELQGADIHRLANWSRLFQGRDTFKLVGWIAFGLTFFVVLSAAAINLSDFWRRSKVTPDQE